MSRTNASSPRYHRRKGFTLVEIMIVVSILGLIAAIAIPTFIESRQNSVATRAANDFRRYSDLFEVYCLSFGDWPNDGLPGTIPAGMESDLQNGPWTHSTSLGGQWDFEHDALGVVAGVSVNSFTADEATLIAVDELLDDGNLNSGSLRLLRDDVFSYVLEEY